MDEDGLINGIRELLADGYLTRFGPLFNAEQMGGGLTLAALAVPRDADYDRIAELVNAFPEVAHNYAREHTLNMWFVLATETHGEIAEVIEKIEAVTALKVFNLPKLEEYRLGFKVSIAADGGIDTAQLEEGKPILDHAVDIMPTPVDRDIVAATQAGLDLIQRPYDRVAAEVGLSPDTLIARMQEMLNLGWIRRLGVVPNHYKLGLASNGMSVWNLPPHTVPEHGKRIGALDFVSHCYRRPRMLPEWPYNLFVMVHGQNREIVAERVAKISEMLGEDDLDHKILYSTKILKKTGLRIKKG